MGSSYISCVCTPLLCTKIHVATSLHIIHQVFTYVQECRLIRVNALYERSTSCANLTSVQVSFLNYQWVSFLSIDNILLTKRSEKSEWEKFQIFYLLCSLAIAFLACIWMRNTNIYSIKYLFYLKEQHQFQSLTNRLTSDDLGRFRWSKWHELS